MIQFRNILGSALLLCICFMFSCQSEGKVFVGEWQDSRTEGNVWSITKRGSTFKGKRVSGDDFYKYETEEWTFEIGDGGFPSLVPVKEGGSTIIYQPKENRLLRNPPGRAYVKVIKE